MKINYNEEYKKEVIGLEKTNKPSIFLHACCGPCLTYPLTELIKHFKVTVGYINPNIYPEVEHEKRFEELKRFIDEINETLTDKVELVKYKYDYQEYLNAVKGHEADKEGGERCTICHKLRLSQAYEYASENKFDYFTSVMTVSSKKPSSLLNEIGYELQEKYPNTKYLPADFKKGDGNLKGIKIGKEHHLYRQDYCGCSFSKAEREAYRSHNKNVKNPQKV